MGSTGRGGKLGDEMFLHRSADGDSPTIIEPLRISKRSSTASPASSVNSPYGSSWPASAGSGTAYPMPALPYPDSGSRTQEQAQSGRNTVSPAPYPYPETRMPEYDPTRRADSAASGDISTTTRPADGRFNATIAERRGNSAVKPLPESPGPDAPDKEGLFQRPPRRDDVLPSQINRPLYPPPDNDRLQIRDPNSINRLSSTASNATTKAQRGSPPPPETPVMGPGPGQLPSSHRPQTDIEARYAASGIAGAGTLTAMHAQSLASQQRQASYAGMQPTQQTQPPARPWTPTELPGSSAHTPAAIYQGADDVSDYGFSPNEQATSQQPTSPRSSNRTPLNPLEHEMGRLNVTDEPPPAYSQVTTVPGGRYPIEKNRQSSQSAGIAAAAAAGPGQIGRSSGSVLHQSQQPQQSLPQQQQYSGQHEHPAYANEARQHEVTSPEPMQNGNVGKPQQGPQRTPSQSLQPASPPPLPEGWIAHLDPHSGQYYYIHLATQSTQWEFPKGPTPLNLEAPLSPGASMYQNPMVSPSLYAHGPLASPGLPMTPGLMSPSFDQQSMLGMSSSLSNPATLTTQPPVSGIELYKVNATNGVYFGPYLRYVNMDLELGIWYGSILLVTDAPQPPTIHIHQSQDLSPNPRQLKGVNVAKHQRWTFFRYDIDLRMEHDQGAKWTYAITSHLGCTRYEFLIASRYETSWRFIVTSGNDFAMGTSQSERSRLGGVGYMWKDIMQKHVECGGFHVQLGCGNQIYADRLWKEIPSLKQWLQMRGKDVRKSATWTAAHEEDVSHAYFHYYTSHFDQPHLREAFAQIPFVATIDDHDIFDGFGSYPDYMQFSNMFKNIGRIGIEMYLLFQHHTTLEILRNVSDDRDLFTVTGTGWHFVKFLGPAVAVVGPDTRSERNPHQVMAGPTYQGLFPKIAMLPQSVQHCLLMIAVPLIYPRLESMEQIANTVATGKKAVTGAYNMLGKVTSSVAGVVGAKGAVGSGFESVKRAVGKSGLMGSVLNPFGDVEVLDEVKDMWTHDSKDLERTYLIRTLQGIAKNRGIRFTFLSGAVNVCGAGLVHDPSHPSDHKSMYQLISSSVVSAPPSSYVLKLLNSNKPLYVPANGQRSTPGSVSDTKEDMIELFTQDVTGQPVTNRRLMPRRNYVAVLVYDPEAVSGSFTPRTETSRGGGRLSLAADFMVQSEGAYGGVQKYGPVVVPSLEYGR